MRQGTIRTVSIILFILVTLIYLSPLFLPKEIDEETGIFSVVKPFGFWTEKMLKLGLDLRGGMEITLHVDLTDLPRAEHDAAVRAAMTVIENRIDQFGVAEPTLQRAGDSRIVVQLPGLQDFQRARDLIGRTALLEFKLVATDEETQRVISQMDNWLSLNNELYPFLARDYYISGTGLLFGDDGEEIDYESAWHRDILSHMIGSGMGGQMSVSWRNRENLRNLLRDETFQNAVPAGFQILMGNENEANRRADIDVYVLYSTTELTGAYLAHASTFFAGDREWGGQNRPAVSIRFNREGARIFERITGQNLRRRLAIILDDAVYVAPTIQDRIRGGEASITGQFTLQETTDLVIVLKAGNLPAPVEIIEERTVGPSLGSDSIRSGAKAGLIGLILVITFMVIYYRFSGVIAIFALILNTAFVFAALTFLEATLTLPGIAGLILMVGMAIDANVLIFERIKEELRSGKSIRNAIDSGYTRAIVTIIDANITSLIVAIVLYNFGTGPIKGFAITFGIGIAASMFTAIFVTKAIFDTIVNKLNPQKLSI